MVRMLRRRRRGQQYSVFSLFEQLLYAVAQTPVVRVVEQQVVEQIAVLRLSQTNKGLRKTRIKYMYYNTL